MLLRTVLTLAISALGGLVALALSVPAPWIMGGAVSTTAAAMLGVRIAMPDWMRNVSFILVGLSMGANVDRESLSLVGQWPITLSALVIELIAIVGLTGYMLRKLFKLDAGTAYLSSFPGHLSFIMGIASAGVGDPRQIAIIQVIRIMMLTICVPIGAIFLPIEHFAGAVPAGPMALETLVAVGLACALAGWVFVKLKVPAGFVLGAMAVAVTARLNGFFDGSIPAPLTTATFIMIGGLIGTRFVGVTRRELKQAAVGGLIATTMAVAIVTLMAYGASRLVDMPFGQIWLGLAPGALEGMGALGVALGYDPAFVAAHHVVRLLLLTFAIPVVAFLARRPSDSARSPGEDHV